MDIGCFENGMSIGPAVAKRIDASSPEASIVSVTTVVTRPSRLLGDDLYIPVIKFQLWVEARHAYCWRYLLLLQGQDNFHNAGDPTRSFTVPQVGFDGSDQKRRTLGSLEDP